MTVASVLRTAAAGAAVGAIYGVAFFAYFYFGAILLKPGETPLQAWQGWLALTHIAIYAAAGAIAAPVARLPLTLAYRVRSGRASADPHQLPIASASLALTATLLGSIALQSLWRATDIFYMAVAAALIAAITLDGVSARRRSVRSVLADPWVVCFTLVGIGWVWTRIDWASPLMKIGAGLVVLTLWITIGFVVRALTDRDPDRPRGSSFRRRSTLYLAAAVAGAVIVLAVNRVMAPAPASFPSGVAGAGLPDVVLIVMDTVGARHVSVNGYERDTTPYLRRLAERATVYTRAIAASNITLSSHASLLTGQYARRHGAHFLPPDAPRGHPLPEAADTLAEKLERLGYRTAAVIANQWYMDAAYGMAQGFQSYDDRPFLEIGRVGNPEMLSGVIARVAPWAFPIDSWRDFRSGEDVTREAIATVDRMTGDGARPMFLFLNYMDAHRAWVPPPPFRDRFPGWNPRLALFEFERIRFDVMTRRRSIAADERAAMEAAYDAGIAYVDHQIEALARHLDARGRLDNTLFIVTSDHGESFGDHHLLDHGVSTTEMQAAIPLVVKYPGQRTGQRTDALASHVDVLPTVLAAVGADAADAVDGINLREISTSPTRVVVSEAYRSPYVERFGADVGLAETAIYAGVHKLIVREDGSTRLFDLARDPGELQNIAENAPDIAGELTARLGEWFRAVPPGAASPTHRASKEAIERLRSLGYIR